MVVPFPFRLYRTGAHLMMRTAGCRPFRFEHGDARILCWQGGPEDGEPWVMLHGIGSVAASWWVLARHLRHECRMLVPELSVLGGSEVPDGALAVRDGAEMVEALIEERFPGRPVVLVGNSLGGWIGLRLARRRPDLVRRLVLLAPGGYREQNWDQIGELVEVGNEDDARALVDAMFASPPLPRKLLRGGFLPVFRSPAVKGALDKLSEEDALEDDDLRSVTAPTALIWGEHDGIFRVDVAERMVERLPRGVLYRIDTAAHIVQWEAPKKMLAAVDDFRGRRFDGDPTESPSIEVA